MGRKAPPSILNHLSFTLDPALTGKPVVTVCFRIHMTSAFFLVVRMLMATKGMKRKGANA
jgi:hypothetical protein